MGAWLERWVGDEWWVDEWMDGSEDPWLNGWVGR